MSCGAGYGGLGEAFARRVELELVYAELQALLPLPPSREVFLAEHSLTCRTAGCGALPLRRTLGRLAAQA